MGGNKGMIRLRRPGCGLRHYLGTEQSSEEVGGRPNNRAKSVQDGMGRRLSDEVLSQATVVAGRRLPWTSALLRSLAWPCLYAPSVPKCGLVRCSLKPR